MRQSISVPVFLLLFGPLAGCSTTNGRGELARSGRSGDAADVALRLTGDFDRLAIPVEPEGANRMLTATIRGSVPKSVWLAPNEASKHSAFLTKVDDGEYQINLYERAVYDALKGKPEGSFRIFAELPTGDIARSVSIRYTLAALPGELDFPWDKATVTLYQRSVRAIPGSRGQLFIQIGDITAGQVLVSVYGPENRPVLDMTSIRQGRALPVVVGQREYVLILDRLVNLLVGQDFAVFSLLPAEKWERDKIDRLLTSIETSGATFIRNGQELSGKHFAEFLRHKLGLSRELSVDQFIEEIASRSATTGNPYQVRTPDGEIADVAKWLRRQAAAIPGLDAPEPADESEIEPGPDE